MSSLQVGCVCFILFLTVVPYTRLSCIVFARWAFAIIDWMNGRFEHDLTEIHKKEDFYKRENTEVTT